MERKPYFVILNSVAGTALYNGASVTFSNINWADIMPDGPYRVSFSFQSQQTDVSASSNPAVLSINLGVPTTNYLVIVPSAPLASNLMATAWMGLLFFTSVTASGTNTNIYAGYQDNPPVYLIGRPRSGNLTVNILATNNASVFPLSVATNWTLVLRFEPV